jgi:cell division protein FtsQ
MKINWSIIQFLGISILVIFLFGFANHRNSLRKISKVNIHFLDENPPFITEKTVNKLLIQNTKDTVNISKEAVDLKEVETRLQNNPMIKKADVYLTIDGQLNALIQQRKPLARVVDSPDYYIDEDGKKMPLSSVYAARVPLVTGALKNVKDILPFLKKIHSDSFFNKMIVAIEVTPAQNIIAKCRKNDFIIDFGSAKDLSKKFKNFKAFYTKTRQDSTLMSYNKISLQFGNQVIATKK